MTDQLPFDAQSPAHKALAHLMRDNFNEARLIILLNYKKGKVAFNNEVILPLMRADAVTAHVNSIFSITNKGVDIYMKLQDIEAVYLGVELPKLATKRRVDMMSKEPYDGAELKPYTGRPGATDSLKLPSRMGNTLVYRKDAS
jgi:hypothetical protein